jgi:hypothetical protein
MHCQHASDNGGLLRARLLLLVLLLVQAGTLLLASGSQTNTRGRQPLARDVTLSSSVVTTCHERCVWPTA